MKIRILTVSKRQPDWVVQGYDEYARRLRQGMPLELVEVAPVTRGHSVNAETAMRQEAQRLLDKAGERGCLVSLDERGKRITTQQLASWLGEREQDGRDPTFLIGGADGLHASVLAASDYKMSLSDLTLPHGLVRVVLAETLYRAWTVRQNHPYHRA